MKTQSQNTKKNKLQTRRMFSETFKQKVVQEINDDLYNITEVSTLYKVSKQSVYRWLYKYSPYHQKGVIQVVQMESEAQKTKLLMERIAELERHIGLKQLEIDYLNKIIEVSSKELRVDLKKISTSNLELFFPKPSKKLV